MKAIITVGIPCSGKSSYASTLRGKHFFEVNRDVIRSRVYDEKYPGEPFTWKGWKWKWEGMVTEIADQELASAINLGINVIISDTNLNVGRRKALQKRLEDAGYEVEIKVFHVEFDEACRRDALRPNGVGVSVIAEMYEKYSQQFICRAKQVGPEAVIFDVDGTLALMDGRSPFDWDRVGEDKPNTVVVEIAKAMYAAGKTIIIMSGRDGSCYSDTALWLERHGVRYHHFYIRTTACQRDDRIVKSELYFENVDGKYSVSAVFDDRPKVCQMWRSLGLNVVQIGNPYIFF